MPISHYDTVTKKFQKRKEPSRAAGILAAVGITLAVVLLLAVIYALIGLLGAGVLSLILWALQAEPNLPFLNLWVVCSLGAFLLSWIATLFKGN